LGIKNGIKREGWLVSSPPDSSKEERTQLLGREIEGLVVEAKRLGIGLDEALQALSAHWNRLSAGGRDGAKGAGGKGGWEQR
jgi:GntR family transcriptional regulator